MSLRLTPIAKSIFDRLTPRDVSPAVTIQRIPESNTASADGQKVTARLEAVEEGVCPYCHTQMTETSDGANTLWVCAHDRHVVPKRDVA